MDCLNILLRLRCGHRAYLFLASDEASYITGAVLRLDGGIVVGTWQGERTLWSKEVIYMTTPPSQPATGKESSLVD